MKIPALAIPAFAAAESRFDPAWNRNRPLLSPRRAATIPSLAALFPTQQRRDPALFSRVNKMYFSGSPGKRRFSPVTSDKRTLVEDFICTKESMFLIHQTNQYNAFNTIDYTDFALADADCNVGSNHLAWFAVPDMDVISDDLQDGAVNGTEALDCSVDDCSAVEYVAAIMPLDSCGTTAEMATDDVTGEDIILFKNRVRNGAYSTINQQDTHGGITTDAVVEFDAVCTYKASYTMDSSALTFDTNHAALADELSEDAGEIFDFDVTFLVEVAVETPDVSIHVEGKWYDPVTGDHSVKVGETAFAKIELTTPNSLIQMQVDACRLKNDQGDNGPLSYDFIGGDTSGNNCVDPFTNAKLVNEPNDENGLAFISWTMFEFTDSSLTSPIQSNRLECDVTICLSGPDQCPNTCPNP